MIKNKNNNNKSPSSSKRDGLKLMKPSKFELLHNPSLTVRDGITYTPRYPKSKRLSKGSSTCNLNTKSTNDSEIDKFEQFANEKLNSQVVN